MAENYTIKIERDEEVILEVELEDESGIAFTKESAAVILTRIALELDPEAVEAGALYALGERVE
jgi:hypothetical protein